VAFLTREQILYGHLPSGYARIARFLRQYREGRLLDGDALPEIVAAFERLMSQAAHQGKSTEQVADALNLRVAKAKVGRRKGSGINAKSIAIQVERLRYASGKPLKVALLTVAEQASVPFTTAKKYYHQNKIAAVAAVREHHRMMRVAASFKEDIEALTHTALRTFAAQPELARLTEFVRADRDSFAAAVEKIKTFSLPKFK
jgi:hypothetical protein